MRALRRNPFVEYLLGQGLLWTPIGSGEVEEVWRSKGRTLAAGCHEDISVNPTGDWTRVFALRVKAHTHNKSGLIVSPCSISGFHGPFGSVSHTIHLRPGRYITMAAPDKGWGVGFTDLLHIENQGRAASVYHLHILGV